MQQEGGADTANYTPYEEKIRQSFADAYSFFSRHKQPRDDRAWAVIADDLERYDDPLTIALISAVIAEFERKAAEHKAAEGSAAT